MTQTTPVSAARPITTIDAIRRIVRPSCRVRLGRGADDVATLTLMTCAEQDRLFERVFPREEGEAADRPSAPAPAKVPAAEFLSAESRARLLPPEKPKELSPGEVRRMMRLEAAVYAVELGLSDERGEPLATEPDTDAGNASAAVRLTALGDALRAAMDAGTWGRMVRARNAMFRGGQDAGDPGADAAADAGA